MLLWHDTYKKLLKLRIIFLSQSRNKHMLVYFRFESPACNPTALKPRTLAGYKEKRSLCLMVMPSQDE